MSRRIFLLGLSLLWGCQSFSPSETFTADQLQTGGLMDVSNQQNTLQNEGDSPGKKMESGPKALQPQLAIEPLPTNIALNSSPISLQAQLVIKADTENTTGSEVTWTVSPSDLAKIEDNKLYPLGEGTIKLTISATDYPDISEAVFIKIKDDATMSALPVASSEPLLSAGEDEPALTPDEANKVQMNLSVLSTELSLGATPQLERIYYTGEIRNGTSAPYKSTTLQNSLEQASQRFPAGGAQFPLGYEAYDNGVLPAQTTIKILSPHLENTHYKYAANASVANLVPGEAQLVVVLWSEGEILAEQVFDITIIP